ncbi:Superfamily protein [Candidatus Terasakiella magnetica]|nr:Superfamily protein [Candidatus Terasakiella magnetica]
MWASLERYPWRWTLVLLAPLVLFPQIDLWASGLFYLPERQVFLMRSHPLGDFTRKTLPIFLFAAAAVVALAGAGARLSRRSRLFGISPRGALFVVASLALGPGLIVNLILKDYWGRPRPSTIAQFGGPNVYTSALLPSAQCADNCSFPSGHAALGFWTLALALLVPLSRRRPAVAAAVVFGGGMGVMRIAQGGHFLSDVAFSGVIVIGLTLWLHRRIVSADN